MSRFFARALLLWTTMAVAQVQARHQQRIAIALEAIQETLTTLTATLYDRR
jgi:hypothetical protein